MRKLLLIAAILIAERSSWIRRRSRQAWLLRWLKSELITQPARKLFGWIGAERTGAVQGALPAACWEIFPMFGKPTIGNNRQRWDSVALEPGPSPSGDSRTTSATPSTEKRVLAATRKRHARRLANATQTEFQNAGSGEFQNEKSAIS
jgi:hypothetical protein